MNLKHSATRQTEEAAISWDGYHRSVDIATWHLDDVTHGDAIEFAKEHDSEIKAAVDDIAVRERGPDNIGYATVEDGEIVDWTIYAQYLESGFISDSEAER